ncbi:MAG: molecular chaperone DnaJ, partial [Coriobacteriales bacterium]|nr:molecular chaperone DnaJ [Coriobacteriales bacterium]
VRIQPHDRFDREGDHLHVNVQISITQASLGALIEIEGILKDELVDVAIPSGCQNGQVIKIKDRGMPRMNKDSRGDLFIHAEVLIPKHLNKRQQELLEELAQEFGDDVGSKKSRMRRIKEALS